MNKQTKMDNKRMKIQVLSMLQLDEENYHQLLDKINSMIKILNIIYSTRILTFGSNLKPSLKQFDFDH